MKKTGLIRYPPFINECAIYIGKLRSLYNYDLKENHSIYKRGEMGEFVDIIGVKGELIFSYFLQKNDIDHQTSRLLSNNPVISCDIIVGGKNIDVKTLRADATDLLVNKQAHEKNKNIDSYVFIQLIDDKVAKYWIFKHEEVDSWESKKCGYSDAYFLDIKLADISVEVNKI